MARAISGTEGGDEDRIGLVFPVYAWGMPRMVADFARCLKLRRDQYVFAVTTCAGLQGNTLVQLNRRLRANGSRLDAGFAVRGDFTPALPGMDGMSIITFISWLGRNKVARPASERMDEIIQAIADKASHALETTNIAVNALGSVMYGFAAKFFRVADNNYCVNDSCTSCGMCAKVCPRRNVVMKDGRPTWHNDCEMCYACFFSCPAKAIVAGGMAPAGPPRHPDITLDDMVLW